MWQPKMLLGCWDWIHTMANDPFAPLAATAPTRATQLGYAVIPVPPDAPKRPARHDTLGKPTFIWTYLDPNCRILGYIFRFDRKGQKDYRPCTLRRHENGGLQW